MGLEPALSDLFFNHEHDRRNELFRQRAAMGNDPPDSDEQRVCAIDEAREFLALIRPLDIAAASGVEPADLADDFMARI